MPGTRHHDRASRSARAFVLLEVVVSLTILAVTVATVLRSFSQSMSAIRILAVETQSAFFAEQLLDEFEINPPDEGPFEGGFGEDYKEFYYEGSVEYIAPDYDETNRHEEVEQFIPMRLVTIDIYYDNGHHKPIHAVRGLTSALMGFERFSDELKRELYIY